MHSADDFVGLLGSQEDDARNKFTARMLFCKSWAPRIHSGAALLRQRETIEISIT